MQYRTDIRISYDGLLSLFSKRCAEASGLLCGAIASASGTFVPYDTGALAASVEITAPTAGNGEMPRAEIRWTVPYASAVYYGDLRGVRFGKEKNPHASPRWFEKAKELELETWKQLAAEAIKGEVKA